MSNITEDNLAKLGLMLGGTVKEYFTQDSTNKTSVTYTTSEGVEKTAVVEKMDVAANFSFASAQVKAEAKTTVNEIIQAFSDTYKLGLIKGVDYASDDTAVALELGLVKRISLTILPGSYLYRGSVTIKAVSDLGGRLIDSMEKIGAAFQLIFFQGALAAMSPVTPTGKAFNGNQLSSEVIDLISERLKKSAYLSEKNLDIVRNATIFNYQTYRREGESDTVRVYMRDGNKNLVSLSVVPASETDRPF